MEYYPELSEGLVGGKRLAKTWSQSKKLRWAIPDDHIAQNRLFCYNESLSASRKVYITFFSMALTPHLSTFLPSCLP